MKTHNFILIAAALLASLQLATAQITTSEIKTEDTGGVTTIAGNVGIGTTSEGSKLEVYNTAQSGHLLLSANDNWPADNTRIDIDFQIANRGHTVGRIASYYSNSINNGSGGLRFYTRNAGVLNEKLRISSNGKIGIGTDSPDTKLHVSDGYSGVNSAYTPGLIIENDSHVAINLFSPNNRMGRIYFGDSGSNTIGSIEYDHSSNYFKIRAAGSEKLRINANGYVGIGTTTPNHKLEVNGTARATTFSAVLPPWSDFVFDDDFELKPLTEVERFIHKNKHLPDIPSEKELQKTGIDLPKMDAKLLQKIEELMLYTIKQQKEIEALKKEINVLKTHKQ